MPTATRRKLLLGVAVAAGAAALIAAWTLMDPAPAPQALPAETAPTIDVPDPPPAAPPPPADATPVAPPLPAASSPPPPPPAAAAQSVAPAPVATAASGEAELMAEVAAAYRGLIQRQLDEHRIDAKLETLQCAEAICSGRLVDGTAQEYERWGEVMRRQLSARSARSILLHQRRVDGRLQMHFTINIARDIWTQQPPPAP